MTIWISRCSAPCTQWWASRRRPRWNGPGSGCRAGSSRRPHESSGIRSNSPIGPLYVAATDLGLAHVAFGESVETFLSRLDPLAHIAHDPKAAAPYLAPLRAYFERGPVPFDVPIDLSEVPPFRRSALQFIRRIPAGEVWTYKQVAEALGKPKASRAVGQAMASNPVPIVIPCHRVVGSDGSLTGYGGGGGIPTKRWLLHFEGAL